MSNKSHPLAKFNTTVRPTKAQILQAAATIAATSNINLQTNPTTELIETVAKNSVRMAFAIVTEMESLAMPADQEEPSEEQGG